MLIVKLLFIAVSVVVALFLMLCALLAVILNIPPGNEHNRR